MAPKAAVVSDLLTFCRSTFTLTFAIEVIGIEVWHDCNEGWLDLGPCTQGMKIQYQLYPGQAFELDILIWPHVVKIWRGSQYYGWVRTWQYLERRWFTFSIRHVFPVRVIELRSFVATMSPTIGVNTISANAKNDKNTDVYLPALEFGKRRYFAPVIDSEETLVKFMENLIWTLITDFVPASCYDGLFDVPQPVTDIRHQDAVLTTVQEVILNTHLGETSVEENIDEDPIKAVSMTRSRKDTQKEKKKIEIPKVKFELKLSGDALLAGCGRVIRFEATGDRPQELGEVMVFISSHNLPAQDDTPVLFVNIDKLTNIPVKEFKKQRITHLYTRWTLGQEVRDSDPKNLSTKDEIDFNDHHSMLMPDTEASEIIADFMDIPFEIQLRGKCCPQRDTNQLFFGYDKGDRDFGKAPPPKVKQEETDILIAVTKIEAQEIAKGKNIFIKGEYSLYPPKTLLSHLGRQFFCTNDINSIRVPFASDMVIQPGYILESHMTLGASFGLVGKRVSRLKNSFSRLFALIEDSITVMKLLHLIVDLNDQIIASTGSRDMLLTGFAIDTGDVVLLYVEGPKDGQILHIWTMTADFFPKLIPVFSTSARYSLRIYSEWLTTAMPFFILKMYAPLSAVLACPPVYARPTLPLPARSAALKIGRLVASKMKVAPNRGDLPTPNEMNSFRIELCTPLRPSPMSSEETN